MITTAWLVILPSGGLVKIQRHVSQMAYGSLVWVVADPKEFLQDWCGVNWRNHLELSKYCRLVPGGGHYRESLRHFAQLWEVLGQFLFQLAGCLLVVLRTRLLFPFFHNVPFDGFFGQLVPSELSGVSTAKF